MKPQYCQKKGEKTVKFIWKCEGSKTAKQVLKGTIR
jgi:hypothetical protein